MMTAMAISPMMRNVLSVATMLPTDVMASDTATIAPTIVPMIRRMSPLCAPGPLAGHGRAGPSRNWRWAPQRPLEQPRSAQCKPPAMLSAGDSSRARTGNMCVRIADIEAVDNPRRFGREVLGRRLSSRSVIEHHGGRRHGERRQGWPGRPRSLGNPTESPQLRDPASIPTEIPPDGAERLGLAADAAPLRRQRPQRPRPPHLRPHHER
jgi:hypothetical protein